MGILSLRPLVPGPALVGLPEFDDLLDSAARRLGCTARAVRRDYRWCRIWRAVNADPALQGRVAWARPDTLLLTGPRHGPPPPSQKERERWQLHLRLRLEADASGLHDVAPPLVAWAGPLEAHGIPVVPLLAVLWSAVPRLRTLAPWSFRS